LQSLSNVNSLALKAENQLLIFYKKYFSLAFSCKNPSRFLAEGIKALFSFYRRFCAIIDL